MEKKKLVLTGDKDIVIFSPKQTVNSTGTTWASETFKLTCGYPDYFETDTDTVISREI